MRFIKSKAFLGGICLLLAAGIAFFVVPRFYSNQKSTVSIVRPTQEIAVGTVITEAMITSTEVGAYGLPERIAKEFGEVVGKVALENIHAGEFFWFDSLTTEEDYKAAVDENTKQYWDGRYSCRPFCISRQRSERRSFCCPSRTAITEPLRSI